MRDFASCFSEYAVQVSDTSCSSYSSTSCMSPNLVPSIQNAVTCLYRITLSNQKHILATITWSRSTVSQGLSITFGEDDQSTPFKLNTNSRIFRKLKGTKSLEFQSQRIEIFWDLSTGKYSTGPEPVEGYYIFIAIDSELGLTLGDMSEESLTRKFKNGSQTAKFTLISRQEHFSGNTLYSTKAQFSKSGGSHDIVIRCSGDNEGLKSPVLSVCIDKKIVIRIKRLQWNFRGNQTIFLDGLLVDLMWDVHDWFYNNNTTSSGGYAVFMFRTRSGMDSRLWLEEKQLKKDEDRVEFSLLICACKNL